MNGPSSPTLTNDEADYWLDTGDEQNQVALALNPGCPLCHLHWLANSFPREVLRNPLLPMLALEDPAEWHKLLDGIAAGLFLEWRAKYNARTPHHDPKALYNRLK